MFLLENGVSSSVISTSSHQGYGPTSMLEFDMGEMGIQTVFRSILPQRLISL
jgi:hypothetical protein